MIEAFIWTFMLIMGAYVVGLIVLTLLEVLWHG